MRYTIQVTEGPICVAHQLHLPYESKCNELHGHNYQAAVVIQAESLNPQKMVVDFTVVKQVLRKYDHAFLGVPPLGVASPVPYKHFPHVEPSTAEHFAEVLINELEGAVILSNPMAHVLRVDLWETAGNRVTVQSVWDDDMSFDLDLVAKETA